MYLISKAQKHTNGCNWVKYGVTVWSDIHFEGATYLVRFGFLYHNVAEAVTRNSDV